MKSELHEFRSIRLSLPLNLTPLLNFIPLYPLFLLTLHISPVKHVGLGDLNSTEMLRQKTIAVVCICVLRRRKGPLARDR